MITLFLGGVGSGKTASAVRELAVNKTGRKTYSNIITKKLKNVVTIEPSMIIEKRLVKVIKRKGTGINEPIYELNLNSEFWKSIKEPVSVVLDEAHSLLNARRAMNKVNIIITDWMALIRRVLGSSESGYGELVIISQLINRIDIIAREMANQIRYHVCHYKKTCKGCGAEWNETSEMAEPLWKCPVCKKFAIRKHSHQIEVWHFSNIRAFTAWKDMSQNTFYRHYIISDIEEYFGYYDTLQWDNLFSEYY